MMNYPHRPYTQKLLDKGLIKFSENDLNNLLFIRRSIYGNEYRFKAYNA